MKRTHGFDAEVVVVGLCAHGLATIRALALAGLKVTAIEADRTLAGCASRHPDIHLVPDLKGRIEEILCSLARQKRWKLKPVLFLMNDRMVREVANSWARLQEYYRISWADSTDTVLALIDKDNLPGICSASGVQAPVTVRISDESEISGTARRVKFPAIVKPTRPMGEFKALVVDCEAELLAVVRRYHSSAPFIVQQWIPGGAESLRFCSLLLAQGRPIAHFEGQKIYAGADGLGQATTMQPYPDDRLFQLSMRFLDRFRFSGPVSIEFKENSDGSLYLIEPNIGRTEYCVDVCIRNGVNLPLLEYVMVSQGDASWQGVQGTRIWFDTERDPTCWLRLVSSRPFDKGVWRPLFPYFRVNDMGPFFSSSRRFMGRRLNRFLGRILPVR